MLLLLILIIISCTQKNISPYEFNPITLEKNDIALSEIADDIIYIPFDNTYPLGGIYMYRLIDNAIYISAKDLGIVQYDRNGKFVRKIGTLGRGPGEYYFYMNFDIDPKSKSIYIKDGIIIKVYNASGQFQRSISLKDYNSTFDEIIYFDERLFITESIYRGIAKYSWLVLDTNGVLVKEKLNAISAFDSNLPSRNGTYIFDNRIFYWNGYNDTIYSISTDLTYKVSFLISPGEHRWPRSAVSIDPSNLEPFKSFLHNHMEISTIFETKRFFIIQYFYKKVNIALIEKESKNSFMVSDKSETEAANFPWGITNDLDGGVKFQPRYYYVEDDREYMIGLINTYQIKDHVVSREFRNSNPKYPEKKKEFEKLANSLEVTDNPVLMMVRLTE